MTGDRVDEVRSPVGPVRPGLTGGPGTTLNLWSEFSEDSIQGRLLDDLLRLARLAGQIHSPEPPSAGRVSGSKVGRSGRGGVGGGGGNRYSSPFGTTALISPRLPPLPRASPFRGGLNKRDGDGGDGPLFSPSPAEGRGSAAGGHRRRPWQRERSENPSAEPPAWDQQPSVSVGDVGTKTLRKLEVYICLVRSCCL